MDIVVYTDGACSNNGKKSAKAGIGVYFGEGDPRNISERITGKQTNNAAELTAILRAVESLVAHVGGRITIYVSARTQSMLSAAAPPMVKSSLRSTGDSKSRFLISNWSAEPTTCVRVFRLSLSNTLEPTLDYKMKTVWVTKVPTDWPTKLLAVYPVPMKIGVSGEYTCGFLTPRRMRRRRSGLSGIPERSGGILGLTTASRLSC